MDDFDSFINSLVDEPISRAMPKAAAPTFPCGQCAGTGTYQGARVHQEKSHCFACKGKGFFLTDPNRRAKANQSRRVKAAEAVADFRADNADLLARLRDIAEWNVFAADLYSQAATKPLTENQVKAAWSVLAKIDAHRAEKAAAKAAELAAAPAVDLAPIKEMFDRAVGNGYKKPAYRAEGLALKRAPDHGANAGALYVTDAESDAYFGKVLNGKFQAPRSVDKETADRVTASLLAIAADPLDAAVRFGRKTGTCACCGRRLDNAESVRLGIGPICRAKWF